MKVLVFGEILWDVIDGVPHLGGAPLNFAAHIVQCGGEASIISCLGEDELGERALASVKELQVGSELIQRSKKRTGIVNVELDNGQPEYEIVKDVAYDYIKSRDLESSNLTNFNIFYFGTLIQRHDVSASALKAILQNNTFDEVFYDVNLRKDCYSKEIIEQSLEFCTTLKVNDEEVSLLGEMIFGEKKGFELFSRLITNRYPQIRSIVITAGAKGALVYSEGSLKKIPTQDVNVRDAVGAGDAFSAAFVSKYYQEGNPVNAAEVANLVGGFVASQSGPIPIYSSEIKQNFGK